MYDLLYELSSYKLYSSTLSAETIQEELEVLQSNRDIIGVKLSIINLDKVRITNNPVHNKLFLEFIMYLIYIDELTDDLEEIYKGYLTNNNVYNELIGFYDSIETKHREVNTLLDKNGSTLQFVGWMEGRALNLSCDAVFIIGYEDE